MHRVFLDANVLFSAAYREGAGLRRLWKLKDVQLVTSAYAVAEARANLHSGDQQTALDTLTADMEVVAALALDIILPKNIQLPEKDLPILRAAIQAKADYLLTGDVRHFGAYFGKKVAGVTIVLPAQYLATHHGE